MKELRLNIISNWYLNRAIEFMDIISEGILEIKSDANEGILPSAKIRKNLKKLTDEATIFLNKAAVYNPKLDLSREISIRNEIVNFIYN